MTIAELARRHGITAATIRHYEKYGLFDDQHLTRSANGYRIFSPLASQRLHLIRAGQLVGFSLSEMAGRLRHWDDGTMSAAEKKQVLKVQLSRLRSRIEELRSVEAFVERELAKDC